MWRVELRGGAFDGFQGSTAADPEPVVIAWACRGRGCGGHATFDAHDANIVLRTAETYTLAEQDTEKRMAIYEIGERSPGGGREERETVGVGGELVPA